MFCVCFGKSSGKRRLVVEDSRQKHVCDDDGSPFNKGIIQIGEQKPPNLGPQIDPMICFGNFVEFNCILDTTLLPGVSAQQKQLMIVCSVCCFSCSTTQVVKGNHGSTITIYSSSTGCSLARVAVENYLSTTKTIIGR